MNFSKEIIAKVNHIKADEINEKEEFSHILIAGEFNFKEIVENCMKQLVSGGILTVYSSFLESLVDLSEYLMTTLVFG
jgi:precorrin-6B methylase 2